jgi:hypothetical protein
MGKGALRRWEGEKMSGLGRLGRVDEWEDE